MTAAASTTTTTASTLKTALIPKIAGAAKVISGAPRLTGSGDHRKQPPHTRAVALLANDPNIRILIAGQQLKTGIAIMAIIFVERHGQTTYLSVPEKPVAQDNLMQRMLS
jgi:hypothetical protein